MPATNTARENLIARTKADYLRAQFAAVSTVSRSNATRATFLPYARATSYTDALSAERTGHALARKNLTDCGEAPRF